MWRWQRRDQKLLSRRKKNLNKIHNKGLATLYADIVRKHELELKKHG